MLNSSENKIKNEMLNEYEDQLDLIFTNYREKNIDFEHLKDSLYWLKTAWNISRVDIKNKGTDSNSVRIFKRDIRYDPDVSVEYPDWFQDEKGKGLKIEFTGRKKVISFQCIGDGSLEMSVRAIDYRNLNNERRPVSINCYKFSLNGKEYVSDDILVHHDKPFYFSKRCHNLERINIEIESKSIFTYCPKLLDFFKSYEVDSVMKDYDEIKKYIQSEKALIQDEQPITPTITPKKRTEPKKTNVAIFGSCVSVDPFRSAYNDYKNDFNKKYEHQRSTMISLMNPKIEHTAEDIKYLLNTHDELFITSDIRRDFDKEIFNHMEGIDYLIINMVHDVRWGVLSYEDTYITNSQYIGDTNFYRNNKDKLRSITIYDNEKEYFELWKENCNRFFEYFTKNYPNLKIVLQKIELQYNYISFDGTYKIREDFQKSAKQLNPYFKKLEQYIEDNFDVITIPFPPETTLDEGNIWGLYSTHYTRSYYQYVFDKIKIHVLEDKLKQ